MLEVTAGFHEELTGRENIFLSGAIPGMTQRSISSRIDQIVEYAGVEDAMHTPVKRYSSGMSARLGFSVAVHLNAEIMLIDEVLAVGDSAFRAKCLETMRSLAASGRSIIFVSHDLDEAFKLGGRIAIMEGGRIVQCGTPREIFSNPASDYVAEFVANMNPLGVLTARDVMGPPAATSGGAVAAETPVAELIGKIGDDAQAIPVVEDGETIGTVTAGSIVSRLQSE